MKREWKPGDVALRVDEPNAAGAIHVRGSACGWWDGNGEYRDPPEGSLRPLAVIDPEDRKQVERVVDALLTVDPDAGGFILRLQAALREYADPKPPKPEEPTGRYAVVVDDEGREWLRTGWDYGFNKPWQHEGTHAHWQTVNAVSVLSEGVTEDGAR